MLESLSRSGAHGGVRLEHRARSALRTGGNAVGGAAFCTDPGMIQVFDRVTIKGYHWVVKVSELRRWLKKQGCMFVEESRHTRIVLGSRISRMPRHPAKEIKRGTLQTVLKDLDLKM